MFRGIHRPSTATVIALLALFVALSGTAVASGVVPLAKRALVADNAKQLQGKTAAQLIAGRANNALDSDKVDGLHAQAVAALPSPSSTAAGMVNVKTAPWTINPRQYTPFTAMCDAGQKAISGGWNDPGGWGDSYESYPTPAGDGWVTWIYLTSAAPGAQSGSVYAICLK
jgi:hypothetical protein